MRAVVGELAAAFSSTEVLGLGGDEVSGKCWEVTPAVTAWMAQQGLQNASEVYLYFVAEGNSMALALGRSPLRWEEVWSAFGSALDPATIIQVWKTRDVVANATSAGYRVVYSVAEDYYLSNVSLPWQVGNGVAREGVTTVRG